MYFNRLQALGMAAWREAADCGARRAHAAGAPARGAAPARVSKGEREPQLRPMVLTGSQMAAEHPNGVACVVDIEQTFAACRVSDRASGGEAQGVEHPMPRASGPLKSGGFNLFLFAFLMNGRIMYLTCGCLIRIIYRKRIQEASHPWQPERSYPLS